jgi:UDP-N-acetylglucosamine--N-acetylmuramyl-(pentapeptide) pyrophosphoryl-undecaprenol N-acetylglucosamine transferase
MRSDTILLVGGGTGGHVFPLIAVAGELRRMAPSARLVFVGTERGIESQVVPAHGYTLELVEVQPIRGRGLLGGFSGVGQALRAIPTSRSLVERLSPKVVFSIGGYAAGPISLAARLAGIPLALMEPNSVTGLANRLIAPWVQRAYTCFAEVERHFPPATVLRTGVAIRRGFEPREYTYGAEGQPRPLRILILGGSQGAKTLNDTLPRALSRCRGAYSVVHQAGKGHDREVRTLYGQLGLGPDADGGVGHARVCVDVVPFISDMPKALAEADLVVGRSGAGAVAEICAVGRPSLLVPYPYASGDHQYKNAQSLVRHGAAVCLRAADATVARVSAEIEALYEQPEQLQKMARAAQLLGKPDAAEVVASDLLELGNVQPGTDDADDDVAPNRERVTLPSEVH